MTKIAVKDANILIDMAVAGLLESWFQLGFATCTTDLVLRQVQQEAQASLVLPFVTAKLIEVVTLDGERMAECALKFRHRSFGMEDASVIFVAQERHAILLSGDRAVVRAGRLEGLEVHGILWVLDELVSRATIPPPLAASKLRTIINSGTFLPEDECHRRLAEWEK